jgi:hypothetical protein
MAPLMMFLWDFSSSALLLFLPVAEEVENEGLRLERM